jgi:multimeric flavodoxin WrbA
MKTLVLFGSARENGNTKALLNAFVEGLDGEIEVVDAYRTSVSPCKDCRYCWHNRGCSIKDGMQDIYKKVDEADNIILASPVYFHSVPGPMKILIDRFQVYWAGHLRKDHPEKNIKKGVILMVGGAPAFEDQFTAGEAVLKTLLNDFAADCVGVITYPHTDKNPVCENEELKIIARNLAIKLILK